METSSLMWLQSPHRASEQPRTQQCLLRKSSQRQVRHIRPQHPLASLSKSASAQLPLPPPAAAPPTSRCASVGWSSRFQRSEAVFSAGLVQSCYTLGTVGRSRRKHTECGPSLPRLLAGPSAAEGNVTNP